MYLDSLCKSMGKPLKLFAAMNGNHSKMFRKNFYLNMFFLAILLYDISKISQLSCYLPQLECQIKIQNGLRSYLGRTDQFRFDQGRFSSLILLDCESFCFRVLIKIKLSFCSPVSFSLDKKSLSTLLF